MQITLANIEDCKELSKLKKSIWEDTYRGIYSDEKINNFNFDKTELKYKNYILSNEENVYVCKNSNEIVGFLVIGKPIHGSLDNYKTCINDLGVKKEYRKQGIGKMFFEYIKNNYTNYYNCCNYYNENGKKFYEKMGGKVVKSEPSDNKEYYQLYYVYDK